MNQHNSVGKAKSYNVVSMFSGCGGLDLGFMGGFSIKDINLEKLPFNIISAFDNDAKCINTYKLNLGENVYLSDLSISDPGEMPQADVLIGGFPCQDFSSCGPLNGLNSERGRLYQALVRYMRRHQPKVVIGENVLNLARMQKGEVLKTIVHDMEDAGYRIKVWQLPALDYGVPQSRIRLFIIGVRNDLLGFPAELEKTHEKNPRTIDWAIQDLETCTDESIKNQSQYFKASRAKRGNGQGDEKNKAGFPSYTIRANAKSRVQFHYSLDRRLTVRECARIQTFPDSFLFPHSITTNIMQIGNAVPPLLAHQVAKSIASYLNSLELN